MSVNHDNCSKSTINSVNLQEKQPKMDDIVIAGMAGKFAKSDNVYQLRDNLFNKVNMVTVNDRGQEKFSIPYGKMLNTDKFDAGFFGVHYKEAKIMDLMTRLTFERVIEAIIDAGYNPSELEGTKTGVFIGVCVIENEKTQFLADTKVQHFDINNFRRVTRSMLANKMSYHLKLNGPSYIVDTACSSSLNAFENAYKSIKNGIINAAVVIGVNLCLNQMITQQLVQLGIISKSGVISVFDENSDGYIRSETCNAVFLQRSKDARRIYGQVVHCKSMNEGYKQEGIYALSVKALTTLLSEVYKECKVSPTNVSYVEAHGTGTVAGDFAEMNSVDAAICTNRTKPLLIGSIKSNIGHTEPASGVTGVIKILLSMHEGAIPPNLNFSQPRLEIDAIAKKRIQVVTENTPILESDEYFAINSFGFGGAVCHALLKRPTKTKIESDVKQDNLPRLVCVSGRTEKAVETILDALFQYKQDKEYIRLYHQIFSKNFIEHHYRGYIILAKDQEVERNINLQPEIKPLHLVFSDFSHDWIKIYDALKDFPIFAKSVETVSKILRAKNLKNFDSTGDRSKVNEIIGNLVVQIGLADMLKALNLQPKSTVGLGLGEFISSYFEGYLTVEETVGCVGQIALIVDSIVESPVVYSIEAEVDELKELQILRHSDKTVVIGNKEKLAKLVAKLKNQGIKVKAISAGENLDNIGFSKIRPNSTKNLLKTKTPQDLNELFLESRDPTFLLSNHLQKTSLIFEIGTIGSFINSKNNKSISFSKLEASNGKHLLLENLGYLHNFGCTMDLAGIYPKIEYPVSRATPMISPFIKWNHLKSWHVEGEEQQMIQRNAEIDVNSETDGYLGGYFVDGDRLVPTMGYLFLVWRTVAGNTEDNLGIVFENCHFLKRAILSNDTLTNLNITFQSTKGYFEVVEKGSVIVTGEFSVTDKVDELLTDLPKPTMKSDRIPFKTEDFYKELRLRGHTYSNDYRNVIECTNDVKIAKIQWTNNWVTFIESILQMSALQIDTCNPCLPNFIRRLSINIPQHSLDVGANETGVNAYIFKDCDLIQCGGIEICGLKMEQIAKKPKSENPMLHHFQFVPLVASLNVHDAILADIELAMENTPIICAKIVELINDSSKSEPLSVVVKGIIDNLPLIQCDLTVLTNQTLNLDGINVENKSLDTVNNCYLIIGTGLLEQSKLLEQSILALSKDGYLLSREPLGFDHSKFTHPSISLFTVYSNSVEKLVFCRKFQTTQPTSVCINVDDIDTFTWFEDLKKSLEIDSNIVIYSENQRQNGILGLINCLRREPDNDKARAVLIHDKNAPKFDVNDKFYKQQLEKTLAINVYQNGQWGTYRHLRIDSSREIECEQCIVNTSIGNEFSSPQWIQGPLKFDSKLGPDQELVHVYYASHNFDSGKLKISSFVGRNSAGQRVMGVLNEKPLSNLAAADKFMLWPVPDQWTMEDAATIPAAYTAAIFALLQRSSLRSGDSILIHDGASEIGQAAINLCLHYGCRVFTTVKSQEEGVFLKKRFQKLTNNVIGSLNDTSFERMIGSETKGRGVDIVFNSLCGDKLSASIRCLAVGGRFLGAQFDTKLPLMEKDVTFINVNLDHLFASNLEIKSELKRLILEHISKGTVQPLIKTVFSKDKIEDALKITDDKIGSVLIKIREEEEQKLIQPQLMGIKGIPKFFCDPEKVVIVLGGLGGFGLELANWLVERGARKLLLVSRKGVRNAYQARKIEYWRCSGATVLLPTLDITTKSGCEQLITEAAKLGEIQSIFNLAVVLHDSLLKNQTFDSFSSVFPPKAYTVRYLDEITRRECPKLRDFVSWSSCTCGVGNPGQTNYGMANSVMERICEKRREDGYPGLVIEWGTIGDVGVFAENPSDTILRTTGIDQQSIKSCLKVLDILLLQDYPVVASFMVGLKEDIGNLGRDVIHNVAKILGLKDLKAISLYSRLTELGVDSLNSAEIRQLLEREFQVVLTIPEIYDLTFARLYEIQDTFTDDN